MLLGLEGLNLWIISLILIASTAVLLLVYDHRGVASGRVLLLNEQLLLMLLHLLLCILGYLSNIDLP